MQSVPANWGSIFSASHKTEYRFTINGVNYEGDDLKDTPVVSKPLLDKPAIGRCCTGSAKVKIYPKGTIPKAATVDVYCRLRKNADNTVTNWLPQGKYYVSSRSGKNLLEITCLDRMIKAGVTYRDKSAFVSWPQPMSAVVNEICSIMGVTLDARTQIKTGAGYTVDYPNDDVLISEILGMIGAAHGGNWIFTETGKLRLVVLASPAGDAVQILGRTHTGFVARGKTQTISRVILVDDAENEFTAGDDSGLTISAKCNYATQAIASTLCSAGGIPLENGCLTIPDAAFSKGLLSVGAATVANGKIDLQTASVLYGVTYEPYTLSGAYLNPAIELGDTLSVTDRDGTVHRVVVFSLDMSCTVSCTCSLSALIDDETEDEYPYITARDLTLKRTVRTDQTYYGNRINRSEGFVSELLVNDVLTARLTANASAFSMQSKEGNNWIDRIYFDNITGKYVITGDVTVQGLATFISGLATSGSTVINGGNITTGQIKSNSGNGFTIDLTNGTISVGNKDLNTALNAIDNEIVISASAQMFTKASGASSYSPASITLTAQSTNTLASYQWYKNNAALSGQTARTLTITPSDISGTSATYKVVGTDAGGQTYTDMMTIAKLADGTSGEKGDKGDQGEKGDKGDPGNPGVGISSVTEYYAINNSSTTAPADNAFSTTVVSPTASKRFLWNYELITYTNQSTERTEKHVAAVYGQKGDTGSPGSQGDPGKGISSIVEYYAISNSTTAPDDNAFSTTVQTPTTSNKYLWNYELITYSDNTTSRTDKRIIGTYGDKGDTGASGVGISSITEYYAINNSTTAPADSAFSTSVVSPTASNRYLWNYELVTYTNGTTAKLDKHIAAVYGQKGDTGSPGSPGSQGDPGVGIASIVEYYAVNNSTTAPAENTFSTVVLSPTASNKYLWNYELITYTDDTTFKTDKRIIGTYGEKGSKGDKGDQGNPGADSYTAILSNEYVEIPVDVNRKPLTAKTYTCVVSVYKGITAMTATTGTPASGQFKVTPGTAPVGVTVAQNTAGTITLTVATNTAILDSSELPLTITVYGGVTVNAKIAIHANMNDVTVQQQSSIEQNATNITLKVSKNSVISEINQSAEQITISAAKINLSGLITAINADGQSSTIDGNKITTGTITATQIASGTITATQIKASTITGAKIASQTIEATNIKSGTITATQIASGTITATQIATGTITATQLAASTITGAKIAANTIECGGCL